MIRFLILILLAYVAFRLIRRYIAPGPERRPVSDSGAVDEMVQDPSCKAYVPRRTAYRRVVAGKEHFFCSEGCADRFEREVEGKGN